MTRKRELLQFVKQMTGLDDPENMLIDYLAREGSLDSLEEKDHSQLLLWLIKEQKNMRGRQTEFSQLKQAC